MNIPNSTILAALLLLIPLKNFAHAHGTSNSYLNIDTDSMTTQARWDVALRDLDKALALDQDGDGKLTWGEIKNQKAIIFAYTLSRLVIRDNGRDCPLHAGAMRVTRHVGEIFLALESAINCPTQGTMLEVDYGFMFDMDRSHRAIVSIVGGNSSFNTVLSAEQPKAYFAPGRSGAFDTFQSFLAEGVWHILHGYDHILFLLTLLLPVLFLRRRKQISGNKRAHGVELLKIVTAFTLAHSITLALVVLGKISLPASIVEPIIAVSIVVAALNNLYPLIRARLWMMGFSFGLIHGFGFAGALNELNGGGSILWPLAGFNLGVELGQLAIVLAVLPLAWAVGRMKRSSLAIYRVGSVSIAGLGVLWLVERV